MHKLCIPPSARQATWKHMHLICYFVAYKNSFYMCSDGLFLPKLFFLLQTLDTSGLQTANMIKFK
jgi:hypothetical protein